MAMDRRECTWRRYVAIIFAIICFLAVNCSGFEQDFTITVDPGREDCFFHTITAGQIIDIEYQVIDGGQGELDINFAIYTPSKKAIVLEYKKTDGAHRHQASENGDYKLCFGNTFSRISSKVVFFELLVDADDEVDDDDDEEGEDKPSRITRESFGVTPEEVYDMKIEDIQLTIDRVMTGLNRVRHFQEQLRAFEARDRNIQEHNFSRVNIWSMIQLAGMILVGLVQVVMLRSLFDDKSRVGKIWGKGKS